MNRKWIAVAVSVVVVAPGASSVLAPQAEVSSPSAATTAAIPVVIRMRMAREWPTTLMPR